MFTNMSFVICFSKKIHIRKMACGHAPLSAPLSWSQPSSRRVAQAMPTSTAANDFDVFSSMKRRSARLYIEKGGEAFKERLVDRKCNGSVI